ncbi:hypothetical protein Tco_0856046 [Tanacetum coccineum]
MLPLSIPASKPEVVVVAPLVSTPTPMVVASSTKLVLRIDNLEKELQQTKSTYGKQVPTTLFAKGECLLSGGDVRRRTKDIGKDILSESRMKKTKRIYRGSGEENSRYR